MKNKQSAAPKKGASAAPMKLKRVIRLDSQPLSQTFFTPEGYLKDRPILTSTGIFEYTNADGSVRRELRLPEDVFDPDSLSSYKGKPIIVTHEAGLITKDNVSDNQIGTILTEGYRSGNDVRAEIIIHDTDEMKECGLKELSLGYNLDLEETPGVWEGEPYDAIQRNIRINHLALVREARAGEQARLNIDSRDSVLKGGRLMKKTSKRKTSRKDGVLTPEELKKAIEEYKARRAARLAAKTDEEEETAVPAVPAKAAVTDPVAQDEEEEGVGVAGTDTSDVEEQVQLVKDRRDRRDEEGDPKDLEAANGVIANQDEDMDILFDIIDTLLAQIAFDDECTEENPVNEDDDPEVAPQTEENPVNEDDDEPEEGFLNDEEEEETNVDDDDDEIPTTDVTDIPEGAVLNADSIDRIVRERVQIGKVASLLNMDGLESMKPMKAKKIIIKTVKPGVRLDGKSAAYINAMFDLSCQEVQKRSRKDTMYQRRQMFNKDSRSSRRSSGNSTDAARERMIARMQKTK